MAQRLLQAQRDADTAVDSVAGLIRLQQQCRPVVGTCYRIEGFFFCGVQLNERVWHGAGCGQAKLVSGVKQRSAGATPNVGRACDGHWLLSAPESELCYPAHAAMLGGEDDARCLRSNERGEVNSLQQTGF